MIHPKVLGTLESALYAPDLDAAEAFYAGVVGLSVIARQAGRHVFFRVGGSVLLVFDPGATRIEAPLDAPIRVPVHGATGQGHYCFSVDPASLGAWAQHLAASGCPVERDVIWPNGARSIYVRDPAGNSIEFADPRLWDQT
jgi:catechol 2,3-dioxygenase-like lactoylglutathione lyase family enzyme